MAKAKSKNGARHPGSKSSAAAADPLTEATELFERGDYAHARVMLRDKVADPALSEGQREAGEELIRAVGFDRGALWVGAACVVLLILVIVGTVLTQP